MASDQEVDHLVKGIKQLLTSFSPQIRSAGSTELAEQAMRHLEENDSNFHRYEFVKHLREQIESSLGSIIEEEIEVHSITPNEASLGQEPVVSQIAKKVLHSEEFTSLSDKLKHKVSMACNILMENFDSEFLAEGSDKSTLGRTGHKRGEVTFSDCESSLGSSMHQSDVMFMNPDQFDEILEKLDKRRPTEARHESLKKLMRVTSMDIQNCDVWPKMRQGLQDSLADSDQTIWHTSLKFIAKSLSVNNPSTREVYTTLVEFLASQFQSTNKSNVPRLHRGLDCNKPDIVKLVKGFRLMNEFQQQSPQYWIRYQDKFLMEILESTLSLLSLCATHHKLITPVHFLALVDPHANWFTKWMHGNYSRSPLLSLMERHSVLVEQAVRSCLDFIQLKKDMKDTRILSSHSPADGSMDHLVYSEEVLEFLYFMHSICMLSRVLCYRKGRQFFPLKLSDRKEPVTIKMLVISLIQLLTDTNCLKSHLRPCSDYEPCRLVVNLLHHLCSHEAVCDVCICQDDVIDALIKPVAYWLHHHHDGDSNYDDEDDTAGPPTEASMLHVADILAHVASNSCGRRQLLHGEKGNRPGGTAVHILSEFSSRAVSGKLCSRHKNAPSLAVIGNIIFVCRQLYSCCEGLHAIEHYNLHRMIADAWQEANQEADRAVTPTNIGEEKPSTANIVLWEDMLRDNLLNLANTPRGLLLLQQTGCLGDCVSYMYTRYARKMQPLKVSRYEKFGYGYMVSQVTATAAGALALQNTGLISSMVHNLWNIMETGDDHLVHIPRAWPVYPIDKSVRKIFLRLCNMLSSYDAVYEILEGVSLPNKDHYTFRENPQHIVDILDRLVVVDTEAKLHSLFNYEQSHVFGLRLLSVLTSCLDTMLLLQSQYNYQQVLLNCQRDNHIENSSDILIDLLSVERNYILVKNYQIGGPSERKLPPRTIVETPQKAADIFPHALFSSFPLPLVYNITPPQKAGKTESELSRFLVNGRKEKESTQWLEKCRKLFCSLLTSKPDLARGGVIADILEQVTDALHRRADDAIYPLLEFKGSDLAVKNYKLTPLQTSGIGMAIRYGSQLKLINGGKDSEDKLTMLIKRVQLFLKQQQRLSETSPLRMLRSACTGFDWFTSTAFLIMDGNVDRSWKFLHKFSALAVSGYIWRNRLHASIHLDPVLIHSGISLVFFKTCHHIENILQKEVCHVYSAFKLSGYGPAQICQHWLRQCFWNYLDWQEICHYICTCAVLGSDYQVYICVAILRHSRDRIMSNMHDKNLLVNLKEEPLVGFKVGEHLEYMQQLESKYRKHILPDMLRLKP